MPTRAAQDLEAGDRDGPRTTLVVTGRRTAVSDWPGHGAGPDHAHDSAFGAGATRAGVSPTDDTGHATPADGQLVEQVRRGESAAFRALVERHDRRAFALAYRLLGHREDAEDVVQESFIAALEALDRFDSARPFGPWLYRIVLNRSLNARKARSRRSAEAIPEEMPSPVAGPDRAAEMGEARRRVLSALDALPDRQRAVLEMIELEGFSGPEVAEILGIPEGTVRWHLHGARKALRAALGPDEGGAA